MSDAGEPRPLRADARRNRDALLETAAAVFEERGVEAPLDEIARRAGVGIGTLYRHFPTRDAVVEAVYRREVELLCSGTDDLLAEHDPVTALHAWMRSFAVYVARKRGMATALRAMVDVDSELFRQSHERIEAAITLLVRRAADTGAIRTDIEPMDLLRGMSGICMTGDLPGAPERTARLVELLVDGLRYGATTGSTADVVDVRAASSTSAPTRATASQAPGPPSRP